MINIVALGLLISSLAAAGVWSPPPDPKPHLAREGHRLIVVEYERQEVPTTTSRPLIQEAKEKFQEAASHLPNLGQGLSAVSAPESDEPPHSTLFEKTKDEISDKASDLKDAAKNAGEAAAGNLTRIAGALQQNLTDIIGRARDVAADAMRYVWAPETGKAAAAVAHLVSVAVAYGTCVWVTFVSSHVMAAALPRQQFGMVQSKLYPVYFRAVAYGVAAAMAAQWFGRGWAVGAERVQGYNLAAVMGLVLANLVYLEPKATKVMFERMKMEKEEGRGRDMADVVAEPGTTTTSTATATTTTTQAMPTFGVTRTAVTVDQEATKSRMVKLNKKLKRLNSYSSFLNILSLMGLTWHLVHLARRLQMTC